LQESKRNIEFYEVVPFSLGKITLLRHPAKQPSKIVNSGLHLPAQDEEGHMASAEGGQLAFLNELSVAALSEFEPSLPQNPG
jgi:hypothetical protein